MKRGTRNKKTNKVAHNNLLSTLVFKYLGGANFWKFWYYEEEVKGKCLQKCKNYEGEFYFLQVPDIFVAFEN